MKKYITSAFAAAVLATMASAQIDFGPIIAGAGNSAETTGVAVSGELTFAEVGTIGTLTYRINNLSDGLAYTYGDLTGFSIGFNTAEFAYKVGTFSVLNGGDSFLLTNVAVTKAIAFEVGPTTGPEAYVLDIEVTASTPGPQNALFGGYWAEFEFQFDILDGATFDGDTFFDAAPAYALTWRMQSVGPDNQLSDAFGARYEPGGQGFGFVPEPSTYGMFGVLALLGLMIVRQTRRR